jgi:GT2 family glycosyltransferase
MLKVSILIPIYNRLNTTQKGLEFLYKAINHKEYLTPKLQIDIIIIDDGSTDGSSQWIKSNYPDITILHGDGNLWWTGSINLGAKYVIDELKSDYILLWNDDIEPKENYFLILQNILLESLGQELVIGSKVMIMGQDKVWSNGGIFNKKLGTYLNITEQYKDNKKVHYCDWLPGMGTIIPTSVITKYNLNWDQINFPHYHGDSDFCLRCKEKNIKIAVFEDLLIFNDINTTGAFQKPELSKLINGLTSIRSSMNLKKNLKFYYRHSSSPIAYLGLSSKYFFYIGSFFKYSVLKYFN